MSSICITLLVGSQVGQVESSQVQGGIPGHVVVSSVFVVSAVGTESFVKQGVCSQM